MEPVYNNCKRVARLYRRGETFYYRARHNNGDWWISLGQWPYNGEVMVNWFADQAQAVTWFLATPECKELLSFELDEESFDLTADEAVEKIDEIRSQLEELQALIRKRGTRRYEDENGKETGIGFDNPGTREEAIRDFARLVYLDMKIKDAVRLVAYAAMPDGWEQYDSDDESEQGVFFFGNVLSDLSDAIRNKRNEDEDEARWARDRKLVESPEFQAMLAEAKKDREE